MDSAPSHSHIHTHTSSTSSATGIDIPSIPASPSSPVRVGALQPSLREGSTSRRRLSWGRMERERQQVADDPLSGTGRLELNLSLPGAVPPGSIGVPYNNSGNLDRDRTLNHSNFDTPQDDPFTSSSSTPFDPHLNQDYFRTRNDGPGASRHSLIHPYHTHTNSFHTTKSSATFDSVDLDADYGDDDEARLTSFASQPGLSSMRNDDDGHDGTFLSVSASDRTGLGGRRGSRSMDMDHADESKLTPQRKSQRYSLSPSPASRLRSVRKTLRRMSVRVVNLAGVGLDEENKPQRLPDSSSPSSSNKELHEQQPQQISPTGSGEEGEDEEELPDLGKRLPIRGRTLCVFGPTNTLRLQMYTFLTATWTEPTILVLIIANAVILTVQAARSVTLPPASGGSGSGGGGGGEGRRAVKGYFHQWEDYALFALFVVFTLESFMRMVTSGFILDPEMPTSMLFTSVASTFTTQPSPTTAALRSSSADPSASMAMSASMAHSALNLDRSASQRNVSAYGGQSGVGGMGGMGGGGASLNTRISNFFTRLRVNLAFPFVLAHQHPHPLTQFNAAQPQQQQQVQSASSRARSDSVQTTTPLREKASSHSASHSHKFTFSHTLMRGDGGLGTGSTSTKEDYLSLPFRLSVYTAHDKLARNVPYLRHSWNRIDFLALVGFWGSFVLAETGVEMSATRHLGVFRALSVLRTSRLLAVTSGTTTIMRSLKRASPLLTNVAYFVLFAMVLFSVIGVQSFKGSFRRSCFLSPTLGEPLTSLSHSCGGYIDPTTLAVTGYKKLDGSTAGSAKGYICPVGQICVEQDNPFSNIESFDTIYFAALQVVIVASANGWSPIMYSMIDAEFFISCFFFIVCIVVLNFWLINLFVAVITNTFHAIRADTKKSAFGAAPLGPIIDEDEDWDIHNGKQISKPSAVRIMYERSKWVWVLFALSSVVLQATRSANSSPMHLLLLQYGELVLTFLFDIDITWRFAGYLPKWRTFFEHGNNWLDLMLAIASSVIQIPVIRRSQVYAWLTIFQLARFYRVILEVPRMRPLLLAVFGNMYGLVNMSLFLILANYVAALVAIQLLRGDLTSDVTMNFGQIYNSFLAMYQVFSSENWTTVLYNAAQAEVALGQAALTALFISGWFLFANFIILQLFIAVINENFDVAEEHKKGQQATHYWARQQPMKAHPAWLRRLNPYRWFKANPKSIAVEDLPSNLVLPMQKSLVQDYSASRKDGPLGSFLRSKPSLRGRQFGGSINLLNRLFTGESRSDDVPLATLRAARKMSVMPQAPHGDEMERHLEILAAINTDTADTQDLNDALHERKALKADFIRAHPTYDKTFWIFSQDSGIRQVCQKLVQPSNGERIFGVPHSPVAHSLFQLLLLLSVIGGIVVEGIATPIYRRNFYQRNGFIRGSWFDIAEATFGFTLLVEFIIKILADGFIFTPNAYLRSIWNVLDFFILVGLLVNTTTGLIFIGGLSRITRSLKALRALRLITLIEKMRSTFQSLIISGSIRILDAALLAILYMIPYAVWGLNIFSGLLNECNDGNATGLADCNNEFVNTPIANNAFGYLAPRVWANPSPSTTFSFDSFRASLLILFEIVSLEGWVDVMSVATSAVGPNLQPQTNVSQANAIFFLIYNLLGAVVILTLFVSIIIGNFSSKTGVAFLTKPQREWIDLQKLIKRQRPSKRPKQRPTWAFRAWCYDRAVHKHGWWSRMMTFFFIIHVFALMTQTLSSQHIADSVRGILRIPHYLNTYTDGWFVEDNFFAAITLLYVVDILVRWFGLGFHSFKANGWNIFDVIVAVGALTTTIIIRVGSQSFLIAQLQKLFLVSIAFKLVQRTNSLNQLFKTAMASLPIILSILALWFILFLFFGILFVEVFSLAKWQSAETRNQNYASLGSALVMLAFMSTGEGWNQYMHDYAVIYPRCTNSSAQDPDSDCGSVGWAFSLFIAWNILSMYIFVNMFTGVVVESFSYVFQLVGGAKSITREEMRSFKKIWAEFANQRTGYLEMNQLVPFLAKLNGVFEVRIYPTEYRVKNLMAAVAANDDTEYMWPSKVSDGLDLNKLRKVLAGIDHASIRKRRSIYSKIYHEARITQEPGKGISFTGMLLMLAHHKLIDDREALGLEELVRRTEINRFVNDLLNVDRVKSLLRTITYRRRFVAQREEKRRQQRLEHQDIPAIVVDDMPTTPPQTTRDITLANRNSLGIYGQTPSPTLPTGTPDLTWMLDTPTDSSPRGLRRNRRTSELSMLSADLGYSYQTDASRESQEGDREEDANNVLSSMQNSLWGEMMLEAAEEH
ncbi:hypothetical protein BD410DRAFT_897507 [Rickenella mellea]|uniref:Calcium-channel protein CCH1 n=1 Tax=Rickenella mellea TaxID=50990 RepID=A0A4Y7Q8A6_9AGAM|nr:hypothetical protein BD410DRAFT_897507 [Rickenella mellea]